MFSGLVLAVALLTGCSSSKPEQPQTAPAAAAQARGAKVAKQGKGKAGKAGKHAKGAKGKAKGGKAGKTAKRAPAQQPIGAEGPVVAELKLGAAQPAEGAGEATEAPAAATTPEKTKADLLLTFGTDGEATVSLGDIKGTCAEVDSVPVGPEGKQQTPLWTVRCTSGEAHTDLYILQIGQALTVVRQVPPKVEGQAASYRPVKRVPLAKGAQLQRKG